MEPSLGVKRAKEPGVLAPNRHRGLIQHFNETHVTLRADVLIHELFEEQVRRTPQGTAVEWGTRSLTYAALNAGANQLARDLQRRGLKPDDVVAVCSNRTGEMIATIIGILKAGGAYLPLDPGYPEERLQQMLEDAAPRLVLAHAQLHSTVAKCGAEVLTLAAADDFEEERLEDVSARQSGETSENLVYVIYTSGSTGRPKGTAMTHRAMVNLIEWHRSALPLAAGQRVLQFAALSFDVSFQEIFSTLCGGGTLVLVEEWVRKDPLALARLISNQRINRLFLPPLMLRTLAESFRASAVPPADVCDVITAGEQLRITPEIRELFSGIDGCRLHNHYGPTETHVVTALTLCGPTQDWPALPNIGRPIANIQIHILDAERQPTPIGVVGEIYIGGEALARGYLHRPELTAQRFVSDPVAGEGRARLYRTGDLGRWNSDGSIDYLGRNDHQVKISGFRIELGDIEAHVAAHGGVQDVVVTAVENARGTKRLVAYITQRPDSAVDVAALRAELRSKLPEHMVPSAIVMIERMPSSPNGKVDRAALPAPSVIDGPAQEYEAPRGEIEDDIARIWSDVLDLARIGRNDNFFDLGGSSVPAMQVTARIRSMLKVEVAVRSLFEHPTLRLFSDFVCNARRLSMRERALSGTVGRDELLEALQAMSEGEAKELLQQLEAMS
jgi:amino acid adenylation domain-containing protein